MDIIIIIIIIIVIHCEVLPPLPPQFFFISKLFSCKFQYFIIFWSVNFPFRIKLDTADDLEGDLEVTTNITTREVGTFN